MHTMAPRISDKVTQTIVKAVREIWKNDRDQLTVNYARQIVEKKLGLEEGFLKEGDWKAKSKQLILEEVEKLQNEPDVSQEQEEPSPPQKKGRTGATTSNGTKKGRRKKVSTPEEESEKSEDVSDRPSKKRKVMIKPKRQSKTSSGDEDDEEENIEKEREESKAQESDSPMSDASEKSEKAAEVSSSELSSVIDDDLANRKHKGKAKSASIKAPPMAEESANSKQDDDSSSELSSVLDEPPPQKRKRALKGSGTTTSKRGSSKSTSASGTDISPDEQQIKLLQTQLLKCGVRKVWAFEFKKRGANTAKEKIAVLKQALVDVGMTGRFSEAKAKEIRERRELAAELGEVIQGEKSWGLGIVDGESGRGARRRAAAQAGRRGYKIEDEESEDEEREKEGRKSGESDDEESSSKIAVRAKRPVKRKDPLAFLGDESDSE